MSRISKVWILLFCFFVSCFSSWAQDSQPKYVNQDLLDIDKIQKEEQLTEGCKVKRTYIFLAIHENNGYKFYAGRFQFDPQTTTFDKGLNDLKNYVEIGFTVKDLLITEDQHICYISGLPKFQELFPNEVPPFKPDQLIEVPAEKEPQDQNKLTGSKSLPLINLEGDSIGIEHFIAFYNLAPPAVDDKGKPKEVTNNVNSYGFIEIKFENA